MGTLNSSLTQIANPDLQYVVLADHAAPVGRGNDRKGMPEHVAHTLDTKGGFCPALISMWPDLGGTARVSRASTSAGLIDTRTGNPFGYAGGQHVYLLVQDGADIPRFLRDLHDRCWLNGLGWYIIGAVGQLLERSIIDRMVGGPERLVFENAPVLEPLLGQECGSRAPLWSSGSSLDTGTTFSPLTPVDIARLKPLAAAARAALEPEAARIRAATDNELATR